MMRLPGSAGLGAATGLRSMAAPSQLSRYLCESPGRAAKGRAAGVMAWPAARSVLQFAALGEMVVDKLLSFPIASRRALYLAVSSGAPLLEACWRS